MELRTDVDFSVCSAFSCWDGVMTFKLLTGQARSWPPFPFCKMMPYWYFFLSSLEFSENVHVLVTVSTIIPFLIFSGSSSFFPKYFFAVNSAVLSFVDFLYFYCLSGIANNKYYLCLPVVPTFNRGCTVVPNILFANPAWWIELTADAWLADGFRTEFTENVGL